jgi:hypothetical protein
LDNIRLALVPQPPGAIRGSGISAAADGGWYVSISSHLAGEELEAAKHLVFDVWGVEYTYAAIAAGGSGPMSLPHADRSHFEPLQVLLQEYVDSYEPAPIWDMALSVTLTEVLSAGIQELMAGVRTARSVAEEIQDIQEELIERRLSCTALHGGL